MPPTIDPSNADDIEERAKLRYELDPVFKAKVDLAVKISVPQMFRGNRAMYEALQEQGIASASIALVLNEA